MKKIVLCCSITAIVCGLAWAQVRRPFARPGQGQAASGPATARALMPATMPAGATLKPGDFTRTLKVDGQERSYIIHVPPKYDPKKPTPVVLNFHGAWANGAIQVFFSGMNEKADAANFIAVYPNGTGIGEMPLFWNTYAKPGANDRPADDVKFTAKLLDDLATVGNIDSRRIYATGMSNGGMMAHLLAVELSDRIAAVAAVSGTLCVADPKPKRAIPVMHIHGTADPALPYDGPNSISLKMIHATSVEQTIATWIKLDGCKDKPEVTKLSDTAKDGTTVIRKVYAGKDGSEVVLYTIEGGGHTWPGRNPGVKFLGKSTGNLIANDVIWDFFVNHPMPEKQAASAPATSHS